MSKFADKLQRIYRTTAQSIGFRKSATETEVNSPLLIADLTGVGVKKASDIVNSGIDAAVISSEGLDASSFKSLVTGTGDIPLGLLLAKNSIENIPDFVDSGCDFIVFDVQTPLESINREGLGKILKIDRSLTPGMVKAINDLSMPIDGVFVAGDASPVTVELVLICQFFADLLDKPLLVTISPTVTRGELSSLREAGVNGLLLPERVPAKVFAGLKKIITGLPKTSKRKTRGSALIPQIGGEQKVEMEEEED